jgi:D-alanyl-D-alanine dipeptidase
LANQQPLITLIADPKVLAIPIIENNDPLVDLKDQAAIDYGPSPEIPNNTDYTKMRNTVYDKLIEAQNLLPQGIRFCLYECYRSLDLQKMLYESRYKIIAQHHPDWSDEQLFLETIKMVSPIVNLDGSRNIPAHSTGGAIDIYLIDDKGDPLDMGIHPKDWMQDDQGVLSLTNSTHISSQAQQNRLMMNQVLGAVGFANYPTEYWHWSYGDRYWAFQLGNSHAIYGPLQTLGG